MKIIFDKPITETININDVDDEYYVLAIDKYDGVYHIVVEEGETHTFKLLKLKTSRIFYDKHFYSFKSVIEYYKNKGFEFEAFLNYKDLINFLNENCK